MRNVFASGFLLIALLIGNGGCIRCFFGHCLCIRACAGSCGSRRDFMRYARECVRFGVPDLYILNPIEDCALTAEDWEEIRGIWDAYRQAQER